MKKRTSNSWRTSRCQVVLSSGVMALLLVPYTHAAVIGDWNLNEGGGTTAIDSSPNGNHGTLVNGTGTAQFIIDPMHGGGVDLNGTGDFIDFGNSPDFDMTIPFSLEFWGVIDFTGNSIIFGKSATSYGLESSNFKGGSVSFVPGTDQWPNNPRAARQYGALVHLVGTYDGTTARIYKDGGIAGIAGSLALDNAAPVATTDPLGAGIANATDATIYHLRLYDEALTGAQVFTLFKQGPNAFQTIASTSVVVEDTLGVSFQTQVDKTYRLQSTSDLVSSNYNDTGVIVFGDGGNMTLFDPSGPSPSKNYRVQESD